MSEHPCEHRCQYAIDIAMPEYSCGNGCMYDKAKKPVNLEALDLAQQIERLEWQIAADTADLARLKARQYALEQGLSEPEEDAIDYG